MIFSEVQIISLKSFYVYISPCYANGYTSSKQKFHPRGLILDDPGRPGRSEEKTLNGEGSVC